MGARKAVISGKPEIKHISTSLTERNNLTMMIVHAPFYPAYQRLFKEAGEP
jgi:hypothetical protein